MNSGQFLAYNFFILKIFAEFAPCDSVATDETAAIFFNQFSVIGKNSLFNRQLAVFGVKNAMSGLASRYYAIKQINPLFYGDKNIFDFSYSQKMTGFFFGQTT